GVDSSATYLNDTWLYNGTSWIQESPSTIPPVRLQASMSYYANSTQLIMFGGFNGSTYLNDTWNWVNTSSTGWAALSPATSPSGRSAYSMAYYTPGNYLLLFGGQNGAGSLNDTWTWNGTTWTQINISVNPSLDVNSTVLYNSATSQLYTFGNTTANTFDSFLFSTISQGGVGGTGGAVSTSTWGYQGSNGVNGSNGSSSVGGFGGAGAAEGGAGSYGYPFGI
ncbi:hypothetical protein B1A_12262, partial [mine drainage metagenome]